MSTDAASDLGSHAASDVEPKIRLAGFTQLSSGKSEDFLLDIVFVHGLGGHPYSTWARPAHTTQDSSQKDTSPNKDPAAKQRSFRARLTAIISPRRGDERVSPKEENRKHEEGRETHKGAKRKRDRLVFWPRDFLAEDFRDARVMTWGYNSSVTKGYQAASQGTIFSHARNLLYSLVSERMDFPNRPLLFIAHSLGGILVKEVLRRAETDHDKEVEQIYQSNVGVIFYGTPHRGSRDWASFGEGVAKVASFVTGIETNSNLVRALLPSAPELEECRESFMRQWLAKQNDLTVRTYQEGRGPTGLQYGGLNRKIVPDDSSSLDISWQRARMIDADHRTMCKFREREEQAYIWVKGDVSRLVASARTSSGRQIHVDRSQTANRLNDLADKGSKIELTKLRSMLTSLAAMNIEQHLYETAEPVASTCRWMLGHPHFLRLLKPEASAPALLHITGKPGCGKTTMSTFLYRELAKRDQGHHTTQRVLIFAFNDRLDGQREPISLFASCIVQLLDLGVDLPPSLASQWEDVSFSSKEWCTFPALQRAFALIMSSEQPAHSSCKKVVCIVDALDECSSGPDRSKLVLGIERMLGTSSAKSLLLGLIVTSRPYSDITFPGIGNRVLDLNLAFAVDTDLQIYVEHGIKRLISCRPPFGKFADELRKRLLARGEKMFLLIELLLELLEGLQDSSARSIEKMLDSLPSSLSEMYDRLQLEMVKKGGDRARDMFSWIVCAFRPLSLREFGQLVAMYDFDESAHGRQIKHVGTKSHERGSAKDRYAISPESRRRFRANSPSESSSTYHDWIEVTSTLASLTPADVEGDLRRLFGPLVTVIPARAAIHGRNLSRINLPSYISEHHSKVLPSHQTVKDHFLVRQQRQDLSRMHYAMAELCVRCLHGVHVQNMDEISEYTVRTNDTPDYFLCWYKHRAKAKFAEIEAQEGKDLVYSTSSTPVRD